MKPFTLYLYEKDVLSNLNIEDSYLAKLDGECCRTEIDFHNEISNSLRFPDYYGRNLDSLFDCLSDLEWIMNENIILHISNFELILSDEPDKSYYQEALLLLFYDLCSFSADEQNSDVPPKNLFIFINNHTKTKTVLDEDEIDYVNLHPTVS